MPIWAGVFYLTGLLKNIMKKVILPLLTYNNKIKAVTASETLSRKVTLLTSGATTVLTLPSSKGRRKEFTVIAAGTSTVATVTAVSPDVIYSGVSATGAATSTVANATTGTYRAIGNAWYRIAT